MENESNSYDNVTQDISSTQSMRPSNLAVPPNSTEPLVSAAPPTSTELPISAAPPNSAEPLNSAEPFVSAAPPTSTELPVFAAPPNSAAPINSNATVEQSETPYPDAPPEYSSIEPPPPYSNPSQYPPTLGIPYLQNYPRGIPGTGRLPHGQHQYPPLGFAQSQGPKPHPHQPQPHQQHQQQQQQQQRVITVDNQCQSASVVASPVSMTGAIILACFVTWFCAYVCGLMALRMAWAGRQLAEVGETLRAIRLRRASYCFSITGIVFGLIIIIVLVCVLTTSKSTSDSSGNQAHVPTRNCRWFLTYYSC